MEILIGMLNNCLAFVFLGYQNLLVKSRNGDNLRELPIQSEL